jgi:hypothetical protein
MSTPSSPAASLSTIKRFPAAEFCFEGYRIDLQRLMADPTGDLRCPIEFSPCFSRAAGKSRPAKIETEFPCKGTSMHFGASATGFAPTSGERLVPLARDRQRGLQQSSRLSPYRSLQEIGYERPKDSSEKGGDQFWGGSRDFLLWVDWRGNLFALCARHSRHVPVGEPYQTARQADDHHT